ncbi:MAG: hypothetical protein U5K38_09345 [Woeseiaceae bacterium]|nr:hypothetical protein [Woeseiaceae bacterium]
MSCCELTSCGRGHLIDSGGYRSLDQLTEQFEILERDRDLPLGDVTQKFLLFFLAVPAIVWSHIGSCGVDFIALNTELVSYGKQGIRDVRSIRLRGAHGLFCARKSPSARVRGLP